MIDIGEWGIVTIVYAVAFGLMGFLLMGFLLFLGRTDIGNKLKLMAGRKKGYREHVLVTAGGDIIRKVMKVGRTIQWDDDNEYYYSPSKAFSINNGGNMWIQGNAQPVNVHKLQVEADGKKLRDDPSTISLATRLAYQAGQLGKKKGKNDIAKELIPWMVLAAIGFVAYLIWKQDESFQMILNAVNSIK